MEWKTHNLSLRASEAIADAAKALGKRALDVAELKELAVGKFVDALRAVAAVINKFITTYSQESICCSRYCLKYPGDCGK